MEELKKENAEALCFQFFGDSINLSNFTLTKNERMMNESHSTRNGINEMSKIDSNFISSQKSDTEIIEKQQMDNFELNKTLKNLTLIPNDQNKILDRLNFCYSYF